jgi:hypothetical protein
MRIAAIIPIVISLTIGEVTERARAAERRLRVCMERLTDTEVEQRARALTTGIFAEIGVRIEWNYSGGARGAITIAHQQQRS